ncbi:MAG: hypothetical protein IT560_12560 [Alphaproteobacteria bacterium]|nr:hypothetical protein [Alphaproteobacteria bacterium]
MDLDPTPNTMTINVTSVNDAPAGADNTITTLEDTPHVMTAAEFGFTDPNDTPANALSAVVITTLPTAGTLRLNGVAVTAGQVVSAANINSGLLVFTPALNANGNAYAAFTFQVRDNGGTAFGGQDTDQSPNTITFNVTSVNDAPAGADTAVTTLEDTPYAFTAANFGFTDAGDSPANLFSSVVISTLPAAGALTLNGVAVTAGALVTVADINAGLLVFTPAVDANGAAYANFTFRVQDDGGTANGGADTDATPNTMTVNVTPVNDAPAGTDTTVTTLEDTSYAFTAANFGLTDTHDTPANALLSVTITTLPVNGTLTLNGVAVTAGQAVTAADINSGLLRFAPALNANGAGYASFTFQVRDNGGTANGGADLDASPNTMTIDVTPVDDAPVLAVNTGATVLEGGTVGITTAQLNATDVDTLPASIVFNVTGGPSHGRLELSTNPGVAISSFTQAELAAGLIQYVHDSFESTTDSFTFALRDATTTLASATFSIAITPVNDAPAGTDTTVTALEDTQYTFTAANFGFTDSDVPANTLLSVTVDTLPLSGSLTLNGVAVTAGQVIAVADINGGLLQFIAAPDANGANYANFTFRVRDNGGTANGGIDTDATANTLTINVTPVNDAPAGTDTTITTLEDTPHVMTAAEFGFTDPNDSPANTLSAVVISALPSSGSLRLNGVAVTAGQVISVANINSGLLVFTPASNANGAANAAFSFQVRDNGGTANAGQDTDQTPNTITFDVTAVNDAPIGSNATVSLLEDSSYAFTLADFAYSDANDTPANSLLAIRIATLPAGGTLTLNGLAVTAGQFIDPADITAGLLVFTPVANGAGTNYSGFTFQLQDDGGTANGGFDLDQTPNRIQIDVTRVNDAPSGTDRTVTTLEDIPHVFTAGDFGLTDVLDSPANALLSVTINTLPLNGSLTLNGVAVTAGQVISAVDIAAGRLSFLSALNENGANYASFDFQVQDNGGTANGGVDTDATPNTITIDVTAVDDPSVLVANTGVTLLEGGTVTITTAQLNATDVDTTDANIIYAVTQQPQHGRLELSTNPGVAITSFTQAELAAGLIRYEHDGGETVADSFRFALRDGTTVLPAQTFAITVNPVNDPISDIYVSRTWFPENAPLGWHLSFLNAVDPDNTSFTWSFVGSPSIFAINGNDLVVNASLDYETTPVKSYTVTIQAFDGEYTYQETFTFDLLDTNEFVQPDDIVKPPPAGNGGPRALGDLDLLDNYILTTVRGIDFTGSELQQQKVDDVFGSDGDLGRDHGFDGRYGQGVAALNAEERARMHTDQKEHGAASEMYDQNPLFKALMRHAQKPASDIAEKLTAAEKDMYRKSTSQQLDDAARYYQSKHDQLVRALTDEVPKT